MIDAILMCNALKIRKYTASEILIDSIRLELITGKSILPQLI